MGLSTWEQACHTVLPETWMAQKHLRVKWDSFVFAFLQVVPIIPVGPDELGGKSQDGEDDLSSMGKKLSPGFCFLLGLGCHIWRVLNLYHLHNKNQRYDSTQAQNFK